MAKKILGIAAVVGIFVIVFGTIIGRSGAARATLGAKETAVNAESTDNGSESKDDSEPTEVANNYENVMTDVKIRAQVETKEEVVETEPESEVDTVAETEEATTEAVVASAETEVKAEVATVPVVNLNAPYTAPVTQSTNDNAKFHLVFVVGETEVEATEDSEVVEEAITIAESTEVVEDAPECELDVEDIQFDFN